MARDQQVGTERHELKVLALMGAVFKIMTENGFQYVPHGGIPVNVAFEQLERNLDTIGSVPLDCDVNDVETVTNYAAKFCRAGGSLQNVPGPLQDVFQGFQRG